MAGSLVLPLVQKLLETFWTLESSTIHKFKVLYTIYNIKQQTTLDLPSPPEISWGIFLNYSLIIGGSITLIYFLFGHIYIIRLIRKAKKINGSKPKVLLCKKSQIPFNYYNNIMLPEHTSLLDLPLIVLHESYHYKLKHYIDLYILHIFQAIYWINPIFHLLKKELKLIHEYQVDGKVISSGIKASTYKMALIKFSVGHVKFALANGFNHNLRSRIMMMNKNKQKTNRLAFWYLVPLLTIIVLSASFKWKDQLAETKAINDRTNILKEARKINLVQITDAKKFDLMGNDKSISVMMNSISLLVINGKSIASLRNVSGKVYKQYRSIINKHYGKLSLDNLDAVPSEISIFTAIGRTAIKEDTNFLINQLSSTIFRLQDEYSNELFNSDYDALEQINKEKIDKLVPPTLYIAIGLQY